MCADINEAAPDPNNARGVYMPPLRESFVMDLRPKIMVIVAAAFARFSSPRLISRGLLLSRVIEREGEFALRAALGASRGRLVREQLLQALLLASLGTICGTPARLLGYAGAHGVSPEGADATEARCASSITRPGSTGRSSPSPPASCCLSDSGSASCRQMRASRTDLRGAIGMTARGATLDRGTRRLLGSLVVVELAIAAALLMASITATQYFRKLMDEPWGFAPKSGLHLMPYSPDRLLNPRAAKAQAVEATLTRIARAPGRRIRTVTGPRP